MHSTSTLRREWSRTLTGLLLATCACSVDTLAVEEKPPTEVENTLQSLESVVAALGKNQAAQDEAWPDRERLLADEVAPPYEVRELQREYAKLWRSRKRIEKRLAREAASEPAAVLSAFERAKSAEMLRLLAPAVARLSENGKIDARAVTLLRSSAERFTPCSVEVAEALAEVGDRDARLFLFELGRRQESVVILRAAARAGEPAVLERLVKWGDSGADDAALALRTVRQLEAPSRRQEALVERLQAWITASRSQELKGLLVTYLGLFRDVQNFDFLTQLCERGDSASVRHAAISALGGLGEHSAPYLMVELANRVNDVALRKACVHALGGSEFLPAAESLIGAMGDPLLLADAARALRRLSGEDFGTHRAVWQRWWQRRRDDVVRDR